jgi:hypothetical protein
MQDSQDKDTSTDEVQSTRECKIKSSGDEIFRTRPDWSCGSPSVLDLFPGVKLPGRGVDHPPPSSAEVTERIELYLCSPNGPSWPLSWRNLPFIKTSTEALEI